MVAVPAAAPYTLPVPDTVAIYALLLVHAPPDDALDRFVVCPMHTDIVPDIYEGDALTVTVFTA